MTIESRPVEIIPEAWEEEYARARDEYCLIEDGIQRTGGSGFRGAREH
jgi:hypothetical protein